MMIRLFISILIFAGLSNTIHAQQMWMFNAHQFNMFDVNHAFAGQYGDASFALRHRSQWVGVSGAPRTSMLSMHAPFGESMGGGLQIKQEGIGLHSWTFFKLAVAYHLEINESRIAVALSPGFASAKFDLSKGLAVDDETGNFVPQSGLTPTFDFSLLYWSETILAGVQVANLNAPELEYVSAAGILNRHVDVFVAYTYVLDRHAIKPILATRFIPGGKVSVDASAQYFWRQKVWIGGGWRSGNSIFGILEFELGKSLRAGYSYDFFADKRLPSSRGSHEIFLGVNFALSKSKARSIRYFN